MEISVIDKLIDKNTIIDSLSVSTLVEYQTGWKKFKKWLIENKISNFGENDIFRYIDQLIGKSNYVYPELSSSQKRLIKPINKLVTYITTGELRRNAFIHQFDFDSLDLSEDAKYYREFLQSVSDLLKPSSITPYKQSLSVLLRYCLNHNLFISELNSFHLSRLFDGSNLRHNTIYGIKLRIKSFLKWLYSQGYTVEDLSCLIPKEKIVRDEKLPTIFTDKEVKVILKSIDRGTTIGRRDFAILLCIAAYGWRISDVAQLKLEDFNWREQTVSFIQVKTGVPIQTKLEPLVFNAIVDYIQHGRPNDKEYDIRNNGELFISLSKSNLGRPIKPNSLDQILYKYIHRAGITKLSNRKHGCHALRFSLATRMIENGADIREVKEVLGHKDKSVTFNYVRLDIAGLKKCNLPMLPCQSPFYSDLKEVN